MLFIFHACLFFYFHFEGIDFKIRTIELDGKKIKLQIWYDWKSACIEWYWFCKAHYEKDPHRLPNKLFQIWIAQLLFWWNAEIILPVVTNCVFFMSVIVMNVHCRSAAGARVIKLMYTVCELICIGPSVMSRLMLHGTWVQNHIMPLMPKHLQYCE